MQINHNMPNFIAALFLLLFLFVLCTLSSCRTDPKPEARKPKASFGVERGDYIDVDVNELIGYPKEYFNKMVKTEVTLPYSCIKY